MKRTDPRFPDWYGRRRFERRVGDKVGENEALLRLCPVTHKASFATEARAQKFVDEGNRTGGPFFRLKRAYLCEHCDHWHTTSLRAEESPHAVLEQYAHLRVVLSALMDPDVVMFACVRPKRIVLDESPMCIPLYWTDKLRRLKLITLSLCTADGYRQISITPSGRRIMEQIGRVDQATIDETIAQCANGYLMRSDS